MTKVRKEKSGDQLAVGDWLAPGEILAGAAEVLFAHSYPAFADRSRDNDGEHVQLVLREQGAVRTYADVVAGTTLFKLASDEDLAELREKADRAARIADLRALATFLEQNPDVPLARYPSEQVDLHDAGNVAQVRALGAKFGGKVREDLDDRTQVYLKVGSFEYRVIAWHPGGRPAEPAPVPSAAPAEEPQCTPECDALYVNITKTGRERRFHHDKCPWAQILDGEQWTCGECGLPLSGDPVVTPCENCKNGAHR